MTASQGPPRKKTRTRKAPGKARHRPDKTHPEKNRPTTATAGRTSSTEEPAGERLQKLLAGAGLGSRRALEKRIEAGEVLLNGRRARLGDRAVEGDTVELDGRRHGVAMTRPAHRTLIYNKPEGEVTTRKDPEGRRTVFDKLPRLRGERWIAIGRLDLNTQGLLLLTTDGELANRMMHPSGNVDREYLCRIRGDVSQEQIGRLLEGVELEDGPGRFSDLVKGESTGGHTWYTAAILEGRNREVRRLWEAVGAQVARLKRVRFGPVFLPRGLRTGGYEELSGPDHRILREDVGLRGRAVELALKSLDERGRPASRRPGGNKKRGRSKRPRGKG